MLKTTTYFFWIYKPWETWAKQFISTKYNFEYILNHKWWMCLKIETNALLTIYHFSGAPIRQHNYVYWLSIKFDVNGVLCNESVL